MIYDGLLKNSEVLCMYIILSLYIKIRHRIGCLELRY